MVLSKQNTITTNLFIELDRITDSTKSQRAKVTKEILKHVLKNFREWNGDPEHQKNFPVTRNFKKYEEIVSSPAAQIYREVICQMFNEVFVKIYGFESFGNLNADIELGLKSKYPRFYHDFFGPEALSLVTSVGELIEQVADGDMINAFCVCNLSFTSPLNQLLSPLALSLVYYTQRFLNKKRIDSNSKETPSKITYISFSGFFSELDVDLLDQLSENVQMIVIYEKSTSEFPIASRIDDVIELNGLQKNVPSKFRSNLLLLPLDCSGGKISSRHLIDLFENVVHRAIKAFAPEAILISHSFNFNPTQSLHGKTNPVPFSLKASTWGKILYNLCLAVNYRVIVFPHKPLLPEAIEVKENENLEKILKEIIPIYSQEWNALYLEECMTLTMEVLSGCKIYNKPRKMVNQMEKYNPVHERHLDKVLRAYRDHPLYHGIASTAGKELLPMKDSLLSEYTNGILEQISSNPSFGYLKKNQIEQEGSKHRKLHRLKDCQEIIERHVSNEILLFNPVEVKRHLEQTQNWVSKHSLVGPNKMEIFPLKESQYVVDYPNQTLYYFNVFWEDGYTDFAFKVDFKQDQLIGEKLESSNSEKRFKVGICQGNGVIFWVYGLNEQNCPSNQISYFDCKSKKWIEPKILNHRAVPRHSATCSYVYEPRTNKHFLYVFGGISKRNDPSQIEITHNNVEFYEINFKKQTLEFHSIDKRSLFAEKVSYIPYPNSYAFSVDDQILLVGGQKFATSAFETETISTFNFSIQKQCFLKTKPTVNGDRNVISCKRDSEQKLTIADFSKNVYFVEGKYYVLSHCSDSNFLISKISEAPTEPAIYSKAFYDKKRPLMRYSRSNNFSSDGKTPTSKELSADRLTINVFAEQSPRTQVFLYCMTKYLNTLLNLEGAINIQTFNKIIQEAIRDPLFENGMLTDVAKELLRIFPSLYQDSNMKKLLGESVQHIEQSAPSQDLGKAILKNKTKDQLISQMEASMSTGILNRSLSIQDCLIVERIFVRSAKLRANYESQYSRLDFKWLTKDYSDLLTRDPSTIDCAREDTGILREIIDNLGKTLLSLRSHAGTKGDLTLPIVEIEKEHFWEDPLQDKLPEKMDMSDPKLCLEIQNLSEERVLQLLVLFLAELAVREKINFAEILNDARNVGKEDALGKWMYLISSFQVVWSSLAQRLGVKLGEDEIEKIIDSQMKRASLGQNSVNTNASLTKEDFKSNGDYKQYDIEKNIKKKREQEQEHEEVKKEEEKKIDKEEEAINKGKITNETQNSFPSEDESLNNSKIHQTVKRSMRRKFIKDHKQWEEESNATPINIICKNLKTYHSVDNLLEAHSSRTLNEYQFSLDSTGAYIEAKAQGESKRAKIFLYNAEANRLIPFYLEKQQQSSLTIWNSVVYLYLDSTMSRRLGQEHAKKYENCVFYADLRESFIKEEERIAPILFVPVFKTTASLMSRTILADEAGLYLIGGTKLTKSRTSSLEQVKDCDFYGLELFDELSTEILEGWMPSMETKREDLVLAQTKERIYVAGKRSANDGKEQIVLEIFDKIDFAWVKTAVVTSEARSGEYKMFTLEEKMNLEKVLLVENCTGRESTGHIIEIAGLRTTDRIEIAINRLGNVQMKELESLNSFYTEKNGDRR